MAKPLQLDSSEPVATVVKMRRTKGVVIQDCDVYIGRAWNMGGWQLPKSKWSNPFPVTQYGSVATSIARYKAYILRSPELLKDLEELRGKRLGCWCAPGPCHGDVLVELLQQQQQQAPDDPSSLNKEYETL